MKNMHIPLSDEVHAVLMAHAKATGESATAYARSAIQRALWEDEKARLYAEMQAYAQTVAGTPDDFDPAIAALGQEVWQQGNETEGAEQ